MANLPVILLTITKGHFMVIVPSMIALKEMFFKRC